VTAMEGRAVFLDRDGVLNEAVIREGRPYPPRCADEVVIVPDAVRALTRLKAAGYVLVLVTNQPDIARGTTTLGKVNEINALLGSALPLDAIEMCVHDDKDHCDCRKPKPGMLTAAAARFNVSLPASTMIGDRWRDIEAGRRAGCRTILIGDGYNEPMVTPPDFHATSLSECVDYILERRA